MFEVKINPYQIYADENRPKAIKLVGNVVDIVPNQSCKVNVDLWSENEILEHIQLTIDGEEYQNWSDDDNYLIDLVLEKLGLEKNE